MWKKEQTPAFPPTCFEAHFQFVNENKTERRRKEKSWFIAKNLRELTDRNIRSVDRQDKNSSKKTCFPLFLSFNHGLWLRPLLLHWLYGTQLEKLLHELLMSCSETVAVVDGQGLN